MNLPTSEEIRALHKKYAPADKVFDLVWNHSNAVLDITQQLIADHKLHVNADAVRVGCLLHDIGVYSLFGNDGKFLRNIEYIRHITKGEAILKAEGFPEYIWRFASHHTGVGLTSSDILKQKLPLPKKDYLAESDEEALVMYADKFHSKSNPPYFNSYAWYGNYLAKFGNEKVGIFEEMVKKFGLPELEPLSKKYGCGIR